MASLEILERLNWPEKDGLLNCVKPAQFDKLNNMFKLVSWDVEIARLPEVSFAPTADLGITCGVTLSNTPVSDGFKTKMEGATWYGQGINGIPLAEMTMADKRMLLDELAGLSRDGVRGLTWNGAAFDYRLLGHETGQLEIAREACLEHIDLMLLFGSIRRHRLSLKAAAAGVGSHKGVEGLASGADVPNLWPEDADLVLAYCIQDCRSTLDVFEHLVKYGSFSWFSQKGRRNNFVLPTALLDKPERWTVRQVLEMAWMPPENWITSPLMPYETVWSWLR